VTGGATGRACDACRARTALLASLVARIDGHRHDRHRLSALLALSDADLVRALGLPEAPVDPSPPVPRSGAAGWALCRHDPGYPRRLLELTAPPAMLHLAGDPGHLRTLLDTPMVAIVGARAPTEYGREVARGLAAALASTGVCIVSGMATGIDAAAHEGALQADGRTLAVLPGGLDCVYPAGKRALHRRLVAAGAAWAELPAGTTPRRWCFVARNRLIAALAAVTLVVEARERSGALITAGYATDLGRDLAAIPGPVTSSRSSGTNALIRDGAHLVRDAQDVLDLLYGVGRRRAPAPAPLADPRLELLLEQLRRGHTSAEELTATGIPLAVVQAGLSELELLGRVRRALSGRYLPVVG
jgi:DNA processing protein